MRKYILKRLVPSLVMALGAAEICWAACDQTLSPGTALATAVASAPNGSTICLNSGDYGNVPLENLSRTGFVTLTSVTSIGAKITPRLWNAHFIRFDRLTLTNMEINNNSSNIDVLNSTFVPNQAGLAIVGSTKVRVDNVDFTKVNMANWAGRLIFNGATYSSVSNSKFIGVGYDPANAGRYAAADGIMLIGQASNNTIGPNNLFSGIKQSECSVAHPGSHCDSIQLYGAGRFNLITGNYFVDDSVFIMAPDGSDDVTVSNNVFDGSSENYPGKIQFGTASGFLFEHNTVFNTNVGMNSKIGNTASTNSTARNNIIRNGRFDVTYGSGCTNCTFTSNLFYTAELAIGTNNLIGIPTYAGNSNPATLAGFQLASTSLGYKVATDGKDMGTNYFGSGTVPPSPTPTLSLAAPRNLHLL